MARIFGFFVIFVGLFVANNLQAAQETYSVEEYVDTLRTRFVFGTSIEKMMVIQFDAIRSESRVVISLFVTGVSDEYILIGSRGNYLYLDDIQVQDVRFCVGENEVKDIFIIDSMWRQREYHSAKVLNVKKIGWDVYTYFSQSSIISLYGSDEMIVGVYSESFTKGIGTFFCVVPSSGKVENWDATDVFQYARLHPRFKPTSDLRSASWGSVKNHDSSGGGQ